MLEILAPAGNMQCAEVAIYSGADAVYLGLSAFSARQNAGNFDREGLCALLTKAHLCGVKVYVAMNTLVKEEELDAFFEELIYAWNMGVDAVILQDVFLGKYIHERYPEIVLHLSTQAGVCNVYGAKYAKSCGFSRVILARETPFSEIGKIAKIIETEVFVQGALCTCFSGQCYFSSFAGGNSGNRGRCKQPCRKQYAYDRNGNQEKCYALSLSDLCVGEDIQKFVQAGVVSFKIEGRMRRAEYVSAAVKYYRCLLDNIGDKEQALSDLRRTYNRGNYTKGLAFGQDKRFLSTAIQGHLGEKVGTVKVVEGKYCVESKFTPQQGDAFKILRDGKEIGGASFSKMIKKGFTLFSKHRLRNGDGVFITTDSAVNERLLQGDKKGKISLSISFRLGEYAKVSCGDICVFSEEKLQSASTRPLTKEEIVSCFLKTDGLPLEVTFEKIELIEDVFIAKSQLNGLRRAFYTALEKVVTSERNTPYEYHPLPRPSFIGRNERAAVIAEDFSEISTDIAVYKPSDFNAPLPESFINGDFEKYLYLPSFASEEDLAALQRNAMGKIDGVYVENYGGILFAQENGWKIFAGTGLNLFNSLSVQGFLNEVGAGYYALSKELNYKEGKSLCGENAFGLSTGNIKIMDLAYCPFGKTCKACDRRESYTLTDENDRTFPVRRYTSANGDCRFEVYNCAQLIGNGFEGAGRLLDLTLIENKREAALATQEEKQKEIYGNYTSGHFKRGVL